MPFRVKDVIEQQQQQQQYKKTKDGDANLPGYVNALRKVDMLPFKSSPKGSFSGYFLLPQRTECSRIWATPSEAVGGVKNVIPKTLFLSGALRDSTSAPVFSCWKRVPTTPRPYSSDRSHSSMTENFSRAVANGLLVFWRMPVPNLLKDPPPPRFIIISIVYVVVVVVVVVFIPSKLLRAFVRRCSLRP